MGNREATNTHCPHIWAQFPQRRQLFFAFATDSREMLRAALFIAMLIALPAAAWGQEREAPSLTLKDLRGRTLRLSDYRGKVVLLNFWATWCPPCGAEIPDLIKLQKEYGGRGLQVLGVTYPPERQARVLRFTRRLKVNYPVALGTRETKALFSSDETLPLTIIIDRGRKLREQSAGFSP